MNAMKGIGFAPDVQRDFSQSVAYLRNRYGGISFSFAYDMDENGTCNITVYEVGGVRHENLDSFFSDVQEQLEDVIGGGWGQDGVGRTYTLNLYDGSLS